MIYFSKVETKPNNAKKIPTAAQHSTEQQKKVHQTSAAQRKAQLHCKAPKPPARTAETF